MPSRKGTEGGRGRTAKGVPGVRAVLASDIHLQARPPVARSGEPDWYEAMAKPLRELRRLAEVHDAPILYAGDIFDRWNAGPEVINFAIEHLPHGYAIPGQHDLPNHNYGEIHRSAYWTLVQAGKLTNLEPGTPKVLRGCRVRAWGCPWGYPPAPCPASDANVLDVAIVHRFIWNKGNGYPGAPAEAAVGQSMAALAGYDAVAYGDNHKGFLVPPKRKGHPWLINCGGFMRRKVDERGYRPGVGLLHSDGSITRHYLGTEGEAFIEATEAEEVVERMLDMSEFMAGLRGLGSGDALDFEAALRRFMDTNGITGRVRDIITEASGAHG